SPPFSMEKVNEYENQLNQQLSGIPQLRQLEETTGVKKTYLVGGVSAIALICVFFNVFGQIITTLVGTVFPAYASFKALQTTTQRDDKQWLTYWVVFGGFSIVEVFVDYILYWLPFYYLFKTFALMWLSLPQFQGAEYVYNQFLGPYLSAHYSKIDSAIDSARARAEAAASEATDKTE
ncbi:MAG: TB2/DP1, HVA22 family-domain-containing protein, partial [Piptocephalis tieghemiana]